MKKFLSILLAGTMLLSFVSCEKDSEKNDNEKETHDLVTAGEEKQTNIIKEESTGGKEHGRKDTVRELCFLTLMTRQKSSV